MNLAINAAPFKPERLGALDSADSDPRFVGEIRKAGDSVATIAAHTKDPLAAADLRDIAARIFDVSSRLEAR
jgi:hypothetical protein